ncbi:hypothetical protein J6590_098023 [Homalodisca vitripennis]|nr:hypothetical protein J6590_098023 [Homalodisca vitripennis]
MVQRHHPQHKHIPNQDQKKPAPVQDDPEYINLNNFNHRGEVITTLSLPTSGYDRASALSRSVTPAPDVPRQKRKNNLTTTDEVAEQQLKAIRPDDEFDAFGKYIAHKLRSPKGNQSVFARKLMNDVIYEGKLETLTKDYKIMITPSQQFNPQLYPPLPNPPYFPQQSDQIFYSQMPYPQHHSSCPSNNIQRPNTPLQSSHTRYPETLKPDAANPTKIIMPKSQKKPTPYNPILNDQNHHSSKLNNPLTR